MLKYNVFPHVRKIYTFENIYDGISFLVSNGTEHLGNGLKALKLSKDVNIHIVLSWMWILD